MVVNIYFLKGFNNYFNRKLRYYSTLQQYITAVSSNYDLIEDVYNFNPNDGITTSQVVSNAGNADYCIVVDADTSSPSYETILSRWFVMDYKRERNLQWTASLYRDVKAEEWQHLILAPAFVEKGTVLDMNDPAIYNKEQVTVNQIKTKEYFIADDSQCPWIVGYLNKNTTEAISGTFRNDVQVDINTNVSIETYLNTEEIEVNTKYFSLAYSSVEPIYKITASGGPESIYLLGKFTGGTNKFIYNYVGSGSNVYPTINNIPNEILSNLNASITEFEYDYNNIKSNARNAFNVNQTNYEKIRGLGGKIIKTLENDGFHYFKFIVTQGPSVTHNVFTSGENPVRESMKQFLNRKNSVVYPDYSSYNTDAFQIKISGQNAILNYEDVTASYEYSWSIPTSRVKTSDQVYDCFAIPYGNVIFKDAQGSWNGETSAQLGLSLAYSIASQAATNLIDIQIIPFCPINGLIDGEINDVPIINFNKSVGLTGTLYTKVDLVESTTDWHFTQHVCYISSAQFTENINKIYDGNPRLVEGISISNSGIFNAQSIIDKKVKIQTEMYRLCSPNWNGQFEFDPQAMGNVDNFNVDVSLIPYSPYIHISPVWGGLYGRDFNDARGLICSGDFSLSQAKDRWAEYMINNKNYENQFQRQIENMEYNNKWQKANAIAGAISGSISGISAGAIAGGAGAAVGAVVGVAGGIADVAQTIGIQKETMDYTKDMHQMSLENIKALPNNITKVSSINNNNKLLIILEKYTCTDVEKEAVENKIKYNGMTIGRIGKFSDFIDSSAEQFSQYVKGKLIRMDWLVEDNHYSTTLNEEMNMGVFV